MYRVGATIGTEDKRELGVAMLVALFAILVISLSAAGVLTLLNQEMAASKMVLKRAQARAIANGGVERVILWLSQNSDAIASPPATVTAGSLGAGSYSAVLRMVSGQITEIAATGTVGGVAVTSRAYLSLNTTEVVTWQETMFSHGPLSVSGSGAVTGDIWTNTDLSATGSFTVSGIAYYVGSVSGNAKGVKTQQATAPLPFPLVDSNYYYRIAAADNEVYNFDGTTYTYALGPQAGTAKAGTTFTPAGGVVWVNVTVGGNIQLSGGAGTITVNNGCMVVKNAVSVSATGNGSIVISPRADAGGYYWPSLILLDGSLTLGGNSGLRGGAYVRNGTVTLGGGAQFYGSLISHGSVTISGGNVDPAGWRIGMATSVGGAGNCRLLFWER